MVYMDEYGELHGKPGENLRQYSHIKINEMPYLPGDQEDLEIQNIDFGRIMGRMGKNILCFFKG